MSIEGVNNSLGSMINIRRQESGTSDSGNDATKLAKLTDSISLSSIDPGLRSVLENISEQGGNVIETLDENVGNLQDGLLETLQGKLSEGGVDLNEKLTLKLDASERLTLTGEHPDKDNILSILNDNPEIEDAFKEVATQSQLMRDIRSIRNVVSHKSAAAKYQGQAELASANTSDSYNVSMRGAMSHFYFSNK